MTTAQGSFATAWRLAVIAAVAVAAVVAVARATAPAIAHNQRTAFVASVSELAGVAVNPEDLPTDTSGAFTLCTGDAAVTVAGGRTRGYGGDIAFLLARDPVSLRGVRVTHHQETPGIGDVIDADRSSWIESFAGLPPARAAQVDAVTGATITTRAVISAVNALASTPFAATVECVR